MSDHGSAAASSRAQQLQAYLEDDPENPRLLREVVDIYLQFGNAEKARPVLERMTELCPSDAGTQYRMATLLFQERRFEESLDIARKIIDSGERHPAVRYQFALTLAQLERFDEAEPIIAALVAEGCAIPELPHLYIRTLHHAGKVDEA